MLPADTSPIRLRQGNFLVGATTDTSFTFALPSDMTGFASAKIVLLPGQSGPFPYNYGLSIGLVIPGPGFAAAAIIVL